MIGRNEKIGVARWVDNILISLPLHLKKCFSGENSSGLWRKQIKIWVVSVQNRILFLFSVYSQIDLLFFPALPWPCSISSVATLQQYCCQYYANCNAEYNCAFFRFAIPFFNCGDFCSGALSGWTAVGASHLISLQMVATLESFDGRARCPWSLGCLSDWPNPLLVLLEQLVPMWDWGGHSRWGETAGPCLVL